MTAETPLTDITVIELGHSVAAPFAGEVLGDLGATVIKIEKPEGDDARSWGPPFWHGAAALFQSLNRNKLSVAVDLRNEAELGALKRLILERADVVIQNLRPGTVGDYGLDAAALRRLKPRLIYCTIGAFGARGPYKDKPGYDPLMQAFGGLMSVTGEAGRPPVRVGTPIMDMGSALWAVIGILGALLRRAETGEGATVDTSLYETALAWMGYHAANYQASGELPARHGTGAGVIAPYRAYRTTNGYIVIAAGNDKLFRLLAPVLGHPEWAEDDRFRTNPDRVRNRDQLNRLIDEIVITRTSEAWQGALDAVGVPSAPMQTIDQVLAHPQTAALGMLQPSPDGRFALMGMPVSFDGVRPPFRRAPPGLGADTKEILHPFLGNPGKVSRP